MCIRDSSSVHCSCLFNSAFYFLGVVPLFIDYSTKICKCAYTFNWPLVYIKGGVCELALRYNWNYLIHKQIIKYSSPCSRASVKLFLWYQLLINSYLRILLQDLTDKNSCRKDYLDLSYAIIMLTQKFSDCNKLSFFFIQHSYAFII